MSEQPPDFLTIEEAARVLRIGRTKAYAMSQEWRVTNGESGIKVCEARRPAPRPEGLARRAARRARPRSSRATRSRQAQRPQRRSRDSARRAEPNRRATHAGQARQATTHAASAPRRTATSSPSRSAEAAMHLPPTSRRPNQEATDECTARAGRWREIDR